MNAVENKVEIVLYGKRALVDVDMASTFQRKSDLVGQALNLRKFIAADPVAHEYAKEMYTDVLGKIIRLNRKIERSGRHVVFL